MILSENRLPLFRIMLLTPDSATRAGDIVWFPPGVKHWHGATATQGMTHIAISEALDGKTVDWMEKVTDGQYGPA